MTYKPICTLSYLVSIFLVTCGSSFMIHPHTNDGRIMCHPAEQQQRQISTNTPNPHQKRNSFLHQSIFLTDRISRTYMVTTTNDNQIISPFDHSADDNQEGSNGSSSSTTTTATTDDANKILDLTWENVEKVLDGMRHYLIQDGGNVVIADIDGPIVKLELQGACGTCPSSTQTMKMGLERGLKERIPEIQEVIQSMPQGPALDTEQIDIVLDGVRPFLQVVGGTIDLDRIEGVDSIQPTIWLHMQGSSSSLNSVKLEIAQRLQRHFMMSGLQVQWKE